MKKWILVLIALLVLAGGGFLVTRVMGGRGRAEWRPGTPLEPERINVGVIYITDPTSETSGYAYSHEIGIREMQRAIGLRDDQIIRKVNVQDTSAEAVEHSIRECIAQGANIVIATSWGYMETCEKLADEFPLVIFTHATGVRHNETNFTNYSGRIYQPRYLSGIAAGLVTVTNKIGYVAAMGRDNSEVTGGLDAFALGVESVNPDARIYVKVTNRWFDPMGEAQAARSLITEGADVIAQHCDTPNPQLEAQSSGVWGIGYNSDMKNDAPRTTITSVVWNWGSYYIHLLESVIDGSFTTKTYYGGIDEGVVDLSPLDESLVPPGVAEAVAAARERIMSAEFDVFEGVMETNDGSVVGVEGGALSDEEIQSGIHWYYRNVVEP
ncbi:MAG: BMP family ABC transporter substrate-binding protein [Synergistaceae bacterium]|jgi:basic membrane protein A|nr:BMP family ABC transporter substrate-binding protein [Synergistaceae bacterium]